jgi:hypothetical protein
MILTQISPHDRLRWPGRPEVGTPGRMSGSGVDQSLLLDQVVGVGVSHSIRAREVP